MFLPAPPQERLPQLEIAPSKDGAAARENYSSAPAGLVPSHFLHRGDRVVFNIKGNAYRLVAAVDYQRQIVFIKWIGTHAQYDKIDVRKVRYGD